jgi:hypothetical protein
MNKIQPNKSLERKKKKKRMERNMLFRYPKAFCLVISIDLFLGLGRNIYVLPSCLSIVPWAGRGGAVTLALDPLFFLTGRGSAARRR